MKQFQNNYKAVWTEMIYSMYMVVVSRVYKVRVVTQMNLKFVIFLFLQLEKYEQKFKNKVFINVSWYLTTNSLYNCIQIHVNKKLKQVQISGDGH